MRSKHNSFSHLSEVSSYAQLLLKQGYTGKGKWSLGECCSHLAIMMDFFGRFGILVSLARKLGLMALAATAMRLATRLGIRFPALPFARPKNLAPVSDAAGVKRLVDAIATQKCCVDQFQLWHCAHHLSFLKPAVDGSEITIAASENCVSGK